jgi:hypothetical protein
LVGIVKGYKIGHNIDGDIDRVLLQIEILKDEDIRTIELFAGFGVDTIPANGCRVEVIESSDGYQITGIISDDLESEVDQGEKEIYSTDNPATTKKARILFDKNGNIILNQGTDFAARFNELQTAFNELQGKFNAHTHPYVDTPIGPAVTSATATPSTGDISLAKSQTVKLP